MRFEQKGKVIRAYRDKPERDGDCEANGSCGHYMSAAPIVKITERIRDGSGAKWVILWKKI